MLLEKLQVNDQGLRFQIWGALTKALLRCTRRKRLFVKVGFFRLVALKVHTQWQLYYWRSPSCLIVAASRHCTTAWSWPLLKFIFALLMKMNVVQPLCHCKFLSVWTSLNSLYFSKDQINTPECTGFLIILWLAIHVNLHLQTQHFQVNILSHFSSIQTFILNVRAGSWNAAFHCIDLLILHPVDTSTMALAH